MSQKQPPSGLLNRSESQKRPDPEAISPGRTTYLHSRLKAPYLRRCGQVRTAGDSKSAPPSVCEEDLPRVRYRLVQEGRGRVSESAVVYEV